MQIPSGDAPTARAALRHDAAPPRRSGAAVFASVLLLLAIAAAYLNAIIFIRLDKLFFPGNELALPAPFKAVPGLAAAVPAEPGEAVSTPLDRINILVMGLDRRPSEGNEPTRSDSMFVLTLDPTSHSGGVLSIPRDLWLEIPDGRGGYFQDRINTAYRFGGLNNYRGGPSQAARDAVEHNFPQIRIDYTAVIDFASFIKIIDTLGGVDIQVTEGFRYLEPVSVDDRDGVIPVFKAGLEHMTGVRALYYSRFRDGPDGDLGRIRRQQQVMLAVANKLLTVESTVHAPELWSRFKDAVVTDIPAYRVPGLALLAKQVGLDHVTMRSLGEVTTETVTAGGADVLVAEPADLARVVNDLFYDARLRQEAATVEIRNGTTRSGLARTTADHFILRGLRPSAVNVSSTVAAAQEETTILSYRGKDYTAERLAEWLGVPRSRIQKVRDAASPDGPDVAVILGRDAKTLQAFTAGSAVR